MKTTLFKRSVILAFILGTVTVFFYAEENWRGAHAWKKVEQELRAQGEPISMAEVLPLEIPDSQNMAMAPLWKDVFDVDRKNRELQDYRTKPRIHVLTLKKAGDNSPPPSSLLYRGQKADLAAWSQFLSPQKDALPGQSPAQQLSAFFSQNAVVAREFSEAARLPLLRWPYEYEKKIAMALPTLGPLLDAARYFQLKTICDFESGEKASAWKQVETLFLAANKSGREPGIISGLVAFSLQGIAINTVWEGLARHAWNENELKALEAFVSEQKPFELFLLNLRGERALFLDIMDHLDFKDYAMVTQLSDGSTPVLENSGRAAQVLFSLRPSGWVAQDKVLYAREISKGLAIGVQCLQTGFLPVVAGSRESLWKFDSLPSWLDLVVTPTAYLTLPSLQGSLTATAQSENTRRNALAAIAIERYRLAQGKIPESLGDLLPRYLDQIPLDVMDGQPLRYIRLQGGDYLLYSIGWNGSDDGGLASRDKKKADWVWPSRAGLVELIK